MFDSIKKHSEAAGSFLKEKGGNISSAISQGAEDAKSKITNFSLASAIKDFTSSSVEAATEIDEHLTKIGSPYEINSLRISASASVMAGMTLDMTLTKTNTAKTIGNQLRNEMSITNPTTGKIFKILRSTFVGKEVIKVKDPNNGEILQIQVASGEVKSMGFPDKSN
jgi:hypothetical protein